MIQPSKFSIFHEQILEKINKEKDVLKESLDKNVSDIKKENLQKIKSAEIKVQEIKQKYTTTLKEN